MTKLTHCALALACALTVSGCKKEKPPQALWPDSWNNIDPAIMIEEVDFDARLCVVHQTADTIAVECRRTVKQTGNATAIGKGNKVDGEDAP